MLCERHSKGRLCLSQHPTYAKQLSILERWREKQNIFTNAQLALETQTPFNHLDTPHIG